MIGKATMKNILVAATKANTGEPKTNLVNGIAAIKPTINPIQIAINAIINPRPTMNTIGFHILKMVLTTSATAFPIEEIPFLRALLPPFFFFSELFFLSLARFRFRLIYLQKHQSHLRLFFQY